MDPEALRPVVAVLNTRTDVVGVVLFGSQARGAAWAQSDVDVGVVLDPRQFEALPSEDWLHLHAIEMTEVRRRLGAARP